MLSKTLRSTGYEVTVYAITGKLWRWEVRANGALVRCGTTKRGVAIDAARQLLGLTKGN